MIKRIPLYIEGLDEAMQGGVPENSVVLVAGGAGVMKTSLCLNVLYREALAGKAVVYLSLEQSALSIIQQLVHMGYDLSKVQLEIISDAKDVKEGLKTLKEKMAGKLTIIDFGSIRNVVEQIGDLIKAEYWSQTIISILTVLKEKSLCDVFAFDSLNAYYTLAKVEHPRKHVFRFFESIRALEMTSFMITEMQPDARSIAENDVEDFLADGVIGIQLVERQRKVTREIHVLKMRGTNTSLDVFSLEFKNGKFAALYGGQPPLV